MASSFGGTIKLQGESEYRKALKDITSNLRLMSSELKLTNTAFSSGDKSVKQTKASYEEMNKAVQDQKAKITELRTALAQAEKEYGSNNEKVKSFKTQLNNAEVQLKQMEQATDKSTSELKEMKQGFDDAGQGAVKFGDLLKANVLGDAIVGGLKALGSAVKAVGSAFLDVGKQALDSYADFEQLEGGVKKLFGDDVAETVKNNANNAFKTAGMSANEYMDTVTSFSASLINSLGGDTSKSASYADRAIQDMADNANTFGTDMSMIQNAYQGFAKGNYTMLDNLKLGFAGSKEGMQSLLDKAGEISGKKFDISSFADITEAIHIMQEEMHIAGTTANEASSTISGSVNSMKGAWQNMLTGIADDNADFEQLIENLVESIVTVGENIMPRVEVIINGIVQLVMSLSEKLIEYMPTLLETGMTLLQTILDGIMSMIPQLMPVVIQIITDFVTFITDNLPMILQAGITILVELVKGIAQALPELIPAVIDAVLLMVETLIDNIDLIIDAGIQLILGLADGLIDALPRLIEKAPTIIQKLVDALVRNFPKIVQAGGQLIGKLATGLVQSLATLLKEAPKIVTTIVKGIKESNQAIKNAGKDLIAGLWEGIKSKWEGLKDSVKSLGEGIVKKFKDVFGIKSPSRVFRDEVGNYLAEGVGVGFTDTMSDVSKEMASSIPTEFDTNINVKKGSSSSSSNYDLMLSAFKTALKDVKVVMNDREFGTFVTDTMERVVYS